MLEQTASDGESETGEEGRWVELRILGTVEIWANGQSYPVGSLKERHLLACLAYDVGRQIPADTLVERIWDGAAPPSDAGRRLQPVVSRLRRRLREVTGTSVPSIESSSGIYYLEADPQKVDARRFSTLAARARSLADSGDDEQALRLVDEAEPLWRGEPLAGLPGLWAEQIRKALSHVHLAVGLIRAGIALRRGHFADIVGYLSPLVGQHPTDEALTEHLMLALYGSGRQTDALRAFRAIQRVLREEHGTDPGPRLRQVEHGVLNQVPIADLVPGGITPAPPPYQASRPPCNLPRRTTVVGRTEELKRLCTAITRTQDGSDSSIGVEAITGMAGVGKSALAVHAAYELRDFFPDGQLYVELGAHASGQAPLSPAAAADTLLRVLGVSPEEMPNNLDKALTLWRTSLEQKQLLVILDDAADAEQVRPLLPGGDSKSLVIVTSRRRLVDLPSEQHTTVDTLSQDDAIALFRQRVGGERASDVTAVARVVQLCGRLPLAIRLSASRLASHPTWSTTDLVQRLAKSDDRLAEIRDSSGGIARSFELSYRGLDEQQQGAFRKLGLHTGSEFGPRAAAALTGLSLRETEHLLEDLLDHHMLREPNPHRYRIHDLLHKYALVLAREEDPPEQRRLTLDRLIHYYLNAADKADRILYRHRPRIGLPSTAPSVDTPAWRDRAEVRRWLATEITNLVAAAERAWAIGPPDRAALFAHVLGGVLGDEHRQPSGESLHQRAVSHWRSVGDTGAEARAQLDLSVSHIYMGRYSDGISAAERSLTLARMAGDGEVTAEALHRLAVPFGFLGEFQTSLKLQQEALAIRQSTGDRYQQARTQNNLAITLLQLGDRSAALAAFKAALDGFRESGEERTLALVHNNLGDVYRDMGRQAQARESYERALKLAAIHDTTGVRATMQMNLAAVLQTTGEIEKALALYREALSMARRTGEVRNQVIALNGIGATLRLAGQHNNALTYTSRAREIAHKIGAATEECESLLHLALVEQRLGRTATAVAHAEAALALAQRIQVASKLTRARQILDELRDAQIATLPHGDDAN